MGRLRPVPLAIITRRTAASAQTRDLSDLSAETTRTTSTECTTSTADALFARHVRLNRVIVPALIG